MPKTPTERVALRELAHPVLYEVNARVVLRELCMQEGKPVTLGTLPDALLDEWAGYGLDAVWMMGVWSPSPLGEKIARELPGLRETYRGALPDCAEEDIGASPYAIQAYEVPAALGGKAGVARLRSRLARRGIGLVLDFVPNHTARDHEWVHAHPEYYVQGKPGEETTKTDQYFRVQTLKGERTLAMGRDPSFGGWTDTAQLNVAHPATRKALADTLTCIAEMCDGVRCDMAMLVLSGVFARTWGERAQPEGAAPAEREFWSEMISSLRAKYPAFLFVAEVYWNMEWDLQQLGFDFTYDKILYDRLLREGAGSVRDHLRAEMAYQKRSLRFVENHDEPRVAQLLPSDAWQYAAATIVGTVPGMTMWNEGQFEGRKVKLPVQLLRRPDEPANMRTKAFYARLLGVLRDAVFRHGDWQLLKPRPAWHENYTYMNFLTFWWESEGMGTRLVVVNYAPHSSQCYLDIPLDDDEASPLEFRDLMSTAVYTRERSGLKSKGLYFDIAPYGLHIFEVSASRRNS